MVPLGRMSALDRAAAPRGLRERTTGPSGPFSSTTPMPHKGGRPAAEDIPAASRSPLTPPPFSQRARVSLKATLRRKLYPQLLVLLQGRLRRGLLRCDRRQRGLFVCRLLCPGLFPVSPQRPMSPPSSPAALVMAGMLAPAMLSPRKIWMQLLPSCGHWSHSVAPCSPPPRCAVKSTVAAVYALALLLVSARLISQS